MPKRIIIKKHHPAPLFSNRPGHDCYYKGTVQELAAYFASFLNDAWQWEVNDLANEGKNYWQAKIKTAPKTAKSLIGSLQRAVEVTQGSCYTRDSYAIIDEKNLPKDIPACDFRVWNEA